MAEIKLTASSFHSLASSWVSEEARMEAPEAEATAAPRKQAMEATFMVVELVRGEVCRGRSKNYEPTRGARATSVISWRPGRPAGPFLLCVALSLCRK